MVLDESEGKKDAILDVKWLPLSLLLTCKAYDSNQGVSLILCVPSAAERLCDVRL